MHGRRAPSGERLDRVLPLCGRACAAACAGREYSSQPSAIQQIGVCIVLFGAMGLLFIGGYGAASSHLLARLKPDQLTPGFNEIVFLAFACASFFMQAVYAPAHLTGPIRPRSLEAAIRFAVPGQRALEGDLGVCGLDGGRALVVGFSRGRLAFIFLGSASVSRAACSGDRPHRAQTRPEPLGASDACFSSRHCVRRRDFRRFTWARAISFVPCGVLSANSGRRADRHRATVPVLSHPRRADGPARTGTGSLKLLQPHCHRPRMRAMTDEVINSLCFADASKFTPPCPARRAPASCPCCRP